METPVFRRDATSLWRRVPKDLRPAYRKWALQRVLSDGFGFTQTELWALLGWRWEELVNTIKALQKTHLITSLGGKGKARHYYVPPTKRDQVTAFVLGHYLDVNQELATLLVFVGQNGAGLSQSQLVARLQSEYGWKRTATQDRLRRLRILGAIEALHAEPGRAVHYVMHPDFVFGLPAPRPPDWRNRQARIKRYAAGQVRGLFPRGVAEARRLARQDLQAKTSLLDQAKQGKTEGTPLRIGRTTVPASQEFIAWLEWVEEQANQIYGPS